MCSIDKILFKEQCNKIFAIIEPSLRELAIETNKQQDSLKQDVINEMASQFYGTFINKLENG